MKNRERIDRQINGKNKEKKNSYNIIIINKGNLSI